MNRRWLVNKTNQEFLDYLAKKTSISTALAQILINRGFKDEKSIKDFLSPSLNNLHDPFLMPDMKKAVERIKTALKNNETVLVHGDYDADGITATALLVSCLRKLGLETLYYIPDRITEGYGLNEKGILKTQELGINLLITVDCGISSEKETAMAVSMGIDVIITDHHEPPITHSNSSKQNKLPAATAVVNPHRADSEYPFKHLAGVGVAYKLVQALLSNSEFSEEDSANFLSIVALGTIADSVPLIGENRILTAHGLKAFKKDSSVPWMNALIETGGIGNREIYSDLLSFTIIPRINAVGRLGDSSEVVELFLTADTVKAKRIAGFLDDQNKKRKKVEENVFKSALAMIDKDNIENAIVLFSDEWHPGVLGIVASRLVEMFYRPVFLFSVKGDVSKGSSRSVPPFNIFKGITECSELFIAYGGHSQAAGIKLKTDKLSDFREKINSVIENTLNKDDIVPIIEIDAGIELFKVTPNLLREIRLLEPFGKSNQKPVFGAKGVTVIDPRVVGNNHLKMKSKQKSVILDTIGFCMADSMETIESSYTLDIAFVPRLNEWNGHSSLQLNLKALRPST